MFNQSKITLHFRKKDPDIYSLIKKTGLIEPHAKSDNLFASLCEIIINQQLSDKAAATIFRKFSSLFPNEKVVPAYLLTIDDVKLRQTGPSKSKINFMKGLADKVIRKEIILEELDKLNDSDVRKKLITVKGIGDWSVEMFLMIGLGREDIFSPGDLGLRKAIQKLYGLKKEPTLKQMEKISAKWIPYRTYASRLLWRSLDN